jgi:hypothetical protein
LGNWCNERTPKFVGTDRRAKLAVIECAHPGKTQLTSEVPLKDARGFEIDFKAGESKRSSGLAGGHGTLFLLCSIDG